MPVRSMSQALAAASAAMVGGVDGVSTVHVLLADAVRVLGADTGGILVRVDGSSLELLASDSHAADVLEIHQANSGSGPCFDAVKTGRHIVGLSLSDIEDRWPDLAPTMRATGFHGVRAIPMTWHGRAMGGLNLFWRRPASLSDEDARIAQAFADTCTLAIMQSSDDDGDRLTDHIRAALSGRVAIERAKGILAQRHDLDMASAFLRLIALSEESRQPLSAVAADLVSTTFERK